MTIYISHGFAVVFHYGFYTAVLHQTNFKSKKKEYEKGHNRKHNLVIIVHYY